jgi:hypothetical protein
MSKRLYMFLSKLTITEFTSVQNYCINYVHNRDPEILCHFSWP